MFTTTKRLIASLARAVAQRLDPDLPTRTYHHFTGSPDIRHHLMWDGAAVGVDGRRISSTSTGGVGVARCTCGALSDSLKSREQRRAWHRAHKIKEKA